MSLSNLYKRFEKQGSTRRNKIGDLETRETVQGIPRSSCSLFDVMQDKDRSDYLRHGTVSSDLQILKRPPKPIVVNASEPLYLKGYRRHWGEGLTCSMGLAYGSGLLLGGGYGLLRAAANSPPTTRLLANAVLNSCATHGPNAANRFAVLTLFYCTIGGMFKVITKRPLQLYQSALAGATAGLLYKSASTPRLRLVYGLASSVVFSGLEVLSKQGYF